MHFAKACQPLSDVIFDQQSATPNQILHNQWVVCSKWHRKPRVHETSGGPKNTFCLRMKKALTPVIIFWTKCSRNGKKIVVTRGQPLKIL